MPAGITFVATSPTDGQEAVDPGAPLFAAVRSNTSTLASVQVRLDGALAYAYAGAGTGTFTAPAYAGTAVVVGGYLAVQVRPRRRSPPGVHHALDVAATDNVAATGDQTTHYTTADATTPLLDAALRATRVDRPFGGVLGLDLFRQLLVAATRTRPSSAAVVQLFYRVHFSELRALERLFALPPYLADQLDGVVAADVAAVADVDAALAPAGPLWEAALGDLAALGAPPPALAPLRRARDAPYPQERVAAACAAVLWGAALLAARESTPTTP